MSLIKVLPLNLVNKIAAGEVIERPASVVKELIENSIDAGADSITIEIAEGGKSMISVSDNGSGMDKEDAVLSVKSHATSKISVEEDLFDIHTLGFRGEALASIAAVSMMKILTRKRESVEGVLVEAENSEIISVEPIGCADGTKIEVKSLFYNIPARKKYLGTMEYEFSKILDIVTRYAIIFREISFKLFHNEKIVLFAPKSENLLDKIASIYGKEIASEMIPLSFSSKVFVLDGFISKPSLTRNSKDMQSLYINKRFVRNKDVADYIYEGYHSMLLVGRHPVFVLNMSLEPRLIDVNVHPTKEIVKIENLYRYKDEVVSAVRNALLEGQGIHQVELEKTNAKPVHNYGFQKDRQKILSFSEEKISSVGEKGLVVSEPEAIYKTLETVQEKQQEESFESKIGPYIVLAQLNKTYILCENKFGLMLADQHAAEERVNYEKFMLELKEGNVEIQKLLKPKVVELSPQESKVLSENFALLRKVGFEIEEFGSNSFIVRTVPFIFGRFEKDLLVDMIKELSEIEPNVVDDIKEKRIIMRSCRKSIKAGDSLTVVEMENLLRELSKCEQPFTCPHGRPTLVNVTIAELERKFKRVC